MVTALKLI